MDTPVKPKISRKLLAWAGAGVIVSTVLFLLVTKGTDLGQGEEDAKAAERVREEREKIMSARVVDPLESSKEDARKAEIAVRDKLPPAPSEGVPGIELMSNEIRLREMEATRDVVGKSLNDDERHGVLESGSASGKDGENHGKPKSFVVYTAPAKEGLVSGAANAAADAVAINPPEQEKKPEKPFLSRNDDKVGQESTTVSNRVDGLYWIAPGTIIRAVLLNAVDTRVPGQITARVTDPVYDSRYGRYLVIPAGTTLIGQYDSAIANGQNRVVMSFGSMVTPAGGTINLGGVRSSDALGRVGIPGELHTYFWKRMGVAALLALESVAMDRLASSQTTVNTNGSTSTTSNTSEAAKIISEAAKQEPAMKPVAPNITIEEGQKISVITVAHIEVPPVANKR